MASATSRRSSRLASPRRCGSSAPSPGLRGRDPRACPDAAHCSGPVGASGAEPSGIRHARRTAHPQGGQSERPPLPFGARGECAGRSPHLLPGGRPALARAAAASSQGLVLPGVLASVLDSAGSVGWRRRSRSHSRCGPWWPCLPARTVHATRCPTSSTCGSGRPRVRVDAARAGLACHQPGAAPAHGTVAARSGLPRRRGLPPRAGWCRPRWGSASSPGLSWWPPRTPAFLPAAAHPRLPARLDSGRRPFRPRGSIAPTRSGPGPACSAPSRRSGDETTAGGCSAPRSTDQRAAWRARPRRNGCRHARCAPPTTGSPPTCRGRPSYRPLPCPPRRYSRPRHHAQVLRGRGSDFLAGLSCINGVVAEKGIRDSSTSSPSSPSLIPIAGGYVVAHCWSLFVYQAPVGLALLSDPLGAERTCSALPGSRRMTPWSRPPWWRRSKRSVSIVVGHLLAVLAAHERAVTVLDRRSAIVGQVPLMVIMLRLHLRGPDHPLRPLIRPSAGKPSRDGTGAATRCSRLGPGRDQAVASPANAAPRAESRACSTTDRPARRAASTVAASSGTKWRPSRPAKRSSDSAMRSWGREPTAELRTRLITGTGGGDGTEPSLEARTKRWSPTGSALPTASTVSASASRQGRLAVRRGAAVS